MDLAAGSGPSGMTINRVCQAAGVKPPAIYYHFGSKEGLLGAVVETVAEAWLEQLEASQSGRGDLTERLCLAVNGWRAMIQDPTRPMKPLLAVQLDADGSAEIQGSLKRVYEGARQVVATGIRAAAGEFAEPDVLADPVLGLVQAAALSFHLEPDPERLSVRLSAIARLIEDRVASSNFSRATPRELPSERQ
jgi:AcrR family transcriptional regulator